LVASSSLLHCGGAVDAVGFGVARAGDLDGDVVDIRAGVRIFVCREDGLAAMN